MTWLSVTFSSVALAVSLTAASVGGRVELRDSKERAVLKGHDYSGVVVWLEPAGTKAPLPHSPPKATMVQRNKRFHPHILAVRAGTTVDFPNLDPIFHNAFSNYSGQVFDIGLYKPGSSRSVPMTRPGVVRVFCNIHSNMSAVIVVVDTAWFTTTGTGGAFRIGAVPPGEYVLQFFHERAKPEELDRLKRTVRVNDSHLELAVVEISESGFLPAPHLNKHGQPYDPPSDSYKVVK